MSKPLILVVEDEVAIRELVAFVCETEGFETLRVGTVEEARKVFQSTQPDLVLLDVMLPDASGYDFLTELQQEPFNGQVPVMLLTARGAESDRVKGLDAGADDYIVKPFLPRELTARIRAILRRKATTTVRASSVASSTADVATEEDTESVIECGPLRMNETRFEATVNGQLLKLSAKEFKLLYLFASKPGRVFSRENLLSAVWQSAFVDERTVDVHMLRLRKALAGTAAENMIETVRGVGYRCRAD